jgi:hypothetical protein
MIYGKIFYRFCLSINSKANQNEKH